MEREEKLVKNKKKRIVDICCLQEEGQRGHDSRMLVIYGSRFKLWRFGNIDGVGGCGSYDVGGAL